MYGYIYLTTNLINGRKYIGQKKSSYFKGTGYLGSGKILKQAVEKYGWDNFSVELVEECDSKETLDEREKYWIKYYNAVDDPTYYNIAFGGQSQACRHSPESREKCRIAHLRENLSEETRKRISEAQKRRCRLYGSAFKGKHHTEETKALFRVVHSRENLSEETTRRMSESTSLQNKGRIWINDGSRNKFIRQEDLDSMLSQGYKIGRLQSNEGHKGTFFITNGVENKLLKGNSKIPEGWWKGMTRHEDSSST